MGEQPNEGWNAIHALHAYSRALYPPAGGWIINNYPPLWFYLTGALAPLFGDPIFAGRAAAIVAFAVLAIVIAALLRRLGGSRAAALIGAATFVAISAGLLELYVGLAEPQMLAHAIVAASVLLLLGTRRPGVAALAGAGVVLGLLVKPIVIGLPLAATLWLLRYRRGVLPGWIGGGVGAAALACVALTLGYGAAFWINLTFPRVVTLERLATNFALVSKVAVPLLAFAIVAIRLRLRDEATAFAALALAASMIVIALFGGALGVSINIAFDLVIAASIASGIAYDRLGRSPHPAIWRSLLIAALIVRVAIGMPNPFAALREHRAAQRDAETAAVREVVARLRALPGPVLCEALAACVWAGHASAADLWKLRFEATLGPFMDRPGLIEAIAQRQFGAIVTFADLTSTAADRNLPGLYAALHAWYQPPIAAGTAFLIFLPKPHQASRSSP
jgi:hypothetical protein